MSRSFANESDGDGEGPLQGAGEEGATYSHVRDADVRELLVHRDHRVRTARLVQHLIVRILLRREEEGEEAISKVQRVCRVCRF